MKFNPKDHVMDMRGKQYLEVKWRIVWFRQEHPKGGILTSMESSDPVVMKATVIDDDGTILATGYGTPKTQGIAKGRPFEGAETAAIGRALAVAGYGTQFTDEEEGEHLADAPVEKKGQDESLLPKDDRAWTVAQKNALIEAGLAKNDFAARGMLGLSALPEDASKDEILYWAEIYREYRKTMLAPDAAQKANDEVFNVS